MIAKNEYFPALLKYWRTQRGVSQLDLSLIIDVSARHISFLETGRSVPSAEMILLLADALDVPLRSRNEMLRAANHEARYPEPELEEVLTGHIDAALAAMLTHHEPFPMIVFDRTYELVNANISANNLLATFWPANTETNLLKLLFNPQGQTVIENWVDFASEALRRIQRELLYYANDETLHKLLDDLLQFPHVPADWRQPKLAHMSEPLSPVILKNEQHRLSFLMTVTSFDAPQNITLNELRIESWFPLDKQTEAFCRNRSVEN